MRKIEVKILNPESIDQAEKLMVCAARLTQRGHQISCLNDFMELYEKPYQRSTVANLVKLPHPTIQKFGIINVVIVGASRRFLAQITRHQNEVKYMSASLQYSDYSGVEDFVVPYDLLGTRQEADYLEQCKKSMKNYQELVTSGIDNDSAGYLAPQGMRNILLVSATPYQWKHMIHQRTCRRNTKETRYVMLKIWEQLIGQNAELFSDCGPFCMNGGCEEGKMTCGRSIPQNLSPAEIIRVDFPKLDESIIDEDRRKNAELMENAFYNKENLNPQMRSQANNSNTAVAVPEGVDAELLMKVLANPEMAALLTSLAKTMKV